jgi:two-component system chemotaxis response regulator CheB
MFSSQAEAVERALWAATRSLEESAALGRKLAARARDRDHSGAARIFEERAATKEQHANVLRDLLRQDDKQLPREEATAPEAKSA